MCIRYRAQVVRGHAGRRTQLAIRPPDHRRGHAVDIVHRIELDDIRADHRSGKAVDQVENLSDRKPAGLVV